MNISKFLDMSKWSFLNRKKEKEGEIRYILSLDGGGMRGIIPAYILARIEEDLKEEFNDNRPFYSHFDLVAGTSTGSLIALALTIPTENTAFHKSGNIYPVYEEHTSRFLKKEHRIYKGDIEELASANEILGIYLNKGGEIFKIPKSIRTIFGPIFNDRYDGRAFNSFLSYTLGNTRLDECRVPTIAIAFDTNSSEPYVFSSYASHGFLASEAARASSSAPTYFPPAILLDRDSDEALKLIDGGLAANNPVLMAYSEARALYPNADKFKILSLSTCAPKRSIDIENAAGAVGFASPVFKAYGEAQMAISDLVASSIKDVEYTRIWAPVLEKKIKLDDYSDSSIAILMEAAKNTYELNKKSIDSFLGDISKEKTHECVKLINKPELLEEK